MGLRNFIVELKKANQLTTITKPVSVEYEIAGIIDALDEKPVFFENIKESNIPVVAGLVSSKNLICQSMGITKEQLLPKLLDAIEHPIRPKLVQNAPCQEVNKPEIDLTKLPIMHYTDKDGGKYIASAVSIIKDPQTGIKNMCFHRLMLKDKNHFIARIVEHRGTDTVLSKTQGELDIAICIGNSTAVLLSAATSLPASTDELGMANALEKTDIVKCKTIDLEVPADSEFILEGKITKEKATEGPFLDLTGIVDRTRQQPIVEIKCITHRTNPIYQTILAGRKEHKFLMGMPKEPTIYKEVGKVCHIKDVYITPGGCSWLHAIVQIKKQTPQDGKKAITAAFNGHGSLKHCIIVDEDINIYDPQDVEWAIATRCQADKNTTILSNQPGSSLDPSGDLSEGKKATTAKAGIDATAPLISTGKGFSKVDYIKVDLSKYL
ncbi:MAG: UbiD family decarboxylase [Nitrososphaerota archaeon]|jgi:UbiD family decarboxylase|nr:UbiD family decarboxylase [Nitrososphaerota archaeon]